MGFRFRRSVKIAPGVRLNFGKKSTSVSFGGKGAKYTVSSTGKKTASVGIPGTGLSYVETFGGKKARKDSSAMSKKEKASKSSKPKKPFYKKWWFWPVLVFILIGSLFSNGEEQPTDNNVKTNVSASADTAKQQAEDEPAKKEPEEVKPVEQEKEVVAENVTTEQETKEETKQETEVKQETEQESKPPVEEPKAETPVVVEPVPEEPVVETPPVAEPEPPVVEVDPEVAFREMLKQYNYVGSSESDKYHYPSCRWTNKINDQNLVHFDTEDEAKAAGYSPCGTCKP